jgi:predicted transcriptional regulator
MWLRGWFGALALVVFHTAARTTSGTEHRKALFRVHTYSVGVTDPMTELDETRSKVGRLIQNYQLTGVREQLATQWSGEGDRAWSLRDLATWFNRQLTRAAMEEAGMVPTTREVETTYELLTDEDVTGATKVQTRKELEREGVDVDQLLHDFVSHQAVHTYLTKYRGVSYESETTDEEQVQKVRQTIERLLSRARTVTKGSLERLSTTNRITLGKFDVFISARVFCQDCETDYEVTELLKAGGCQCET